MRRLCNSRGGYVMFEALAALALSGLVLAAVPLASGMLIRSWQKVTQGSDTLDRLSTGLAVVRREMEMLRRQRFERRGGGPYAFLGTVGAVGMVVPDAAERNKKGESIVMLTVRPETGGNTLLRGSAPFYPDTRNFREVRLTDEVVLLTGPWKYQFFYGAQEGGRIEWYPEWPDEFDMPAAFRLDVVDYVSGTRVVPPLVVPLRIEAEPGCIDDTAGECGI